MRGVVPSAFPVDEQGRSISSGAGPDGDTSDSSDASAAQERTPKVERMPRTVRRPTRRRSARADASVRPPPICSLPVTAREDDV